MTLRIRRYAQADYARVLEICVAAFAPIHASFERQLGTEVFAAEFGDWKQNYADQLKAIAPDADAEIVYVAEDNAEIVGFCFSKADPKRRIGEIGLNAVDPVRQGEGFGKAMYGFALNELRKRGAAVAYVSTGSDAAHAPARAAYTGVGFDRQISSTHLFRTL